jgi:hypothetical protein
VIVCRTRVELMDGRLSNIDHDGCSMLVVLDDRDGQQSLESNSQKWKICKLLAQMAGRQRDRSASSMSTTVTCLHYM